MAGHERHTNRRHRMDLCHPSVLPSLCQVGDIPILRGILFFCGSLMAHSYSCQLQSLSTVLELRERCLDNFRIVYRFEIFKNWAIMVQ